jgi:response regulator RpfG family c-di-GMP phosphodiesterase
MTSSDKDSMFADENGGALASENREVWKVMVVDDEEEVHSVTRLVLSHMDFHGRAIEIINCHSGEEAKKAIVEHPDVALMLLDVVMETDDAGLNVVKYVREEIHNHFVRIVLRTGQPGQAPEREVIEKYDINDYKDKTELTSQKLYTLVLTSIRSYRDIMMIEHNKRGLLAIISASEDIFQLRSMRKFAKAVLDQMTSLLQLEANALYCKADIGFAASRNTKQQRTIQIIVATGQYKNLAGYDLNGGVEPEVKERVRKVMEEKRNLSFGNEYYAYFETRTGEEHVLYVKFSEQIELSKVDHDLIDLFCQNVALGFENVYRYNELIIYQGEIVCRLTEILESKAEHLGQHIRRVAKIAECLAKGLKLDEDQVAIIRSVAPLHDIGELAISHELLIKADELSEEEFHNTRKRAEMENGAKSKILRAAATVAKQHHEKWDGSGYPEKLKGDQISLEARISKLADVCDALLTHRAHREAWDLDKVIAYLKEESGKAFDPELVNILIENQDYLKGLYHPS